jgi:hypothetical protein
MAFVPGIGRQPMNISESEIRYAMSNAKSARACARFMNVTYDTFRKYAKMYVDAETGKTLFELSKNPSGVGIYKAARTVQKLQKPLSEILEGKHPSYDPVKLKQRLLRSGEFEEKCSCCSFSERRITDYTVPLILDYMNGDRKDHRRENIRFLCYNCTYLQVKNVYGGRQKVVLIP